MPENGYILLLYYTAMRPLWISLLCLLSYQLHAQKEANNWYFGEKAGITFSSGSPEVIENSAMLNNDGCAVMSDRTTGELLFYTNGRNIWNRNHQLMPNGGDYPADCRSTVSQSALIVPVPGNLSQYYLFAIRKADPLTGERDCSGYQFLQDYTCELVYSIIDMQLDGGLGGVVADRKNITLQTNSTEKQTAVPHTNGRDYWLITHEWNSDAFYVYLISPEDIATPQVTRIGSYHQLWIDENLPPGHVLRLNSESIRGFIEASPDGTKLACAITTPLYERPFDLFDFDATTGTVSNYVNLGNLRYQWGVSFSPDNSKLYVATDSPPDKPYKEIIRQYDLKAGNTQAIIASAKSIIRDNPNSNIKYGYNYGAGQPKPTDAALQLAPDGKIYGTGGAGKTLFMINKPNEAGFACEVNYTSLNFNGRTTLYGLPNFMDAYFNGLEPLEPVEEACQDARIVLSPNPTDGWLRVRVPERCFQPYTLRLFNAIGQLTGSYRITDAISPKIELRWLSAGVYLAELQFEDGRRVVKKLVVIR